MVEVMQCHQGWFEISQRSKHYLTYFYSDLLIWITLQRCEQTNNNIRGIRIFVT